MKHQLIPNTDPNGWEQPNEVTEPDYKALYENLLQGVKDAKTEMNRVKKFQNYDYHSGFNEAISILTDKTGIL